MAARGGQSVSILHDAVWTRQLAEELNRRGVPARRLLTEAGLDPRTVETEDARVPFAKTAAFFELAADATDDPCLGLNFGRSRDMRMAGLLWYVGVSSATVGDAIKNLCRYRKVANDAVEMNIEDLDEHGAIEWWFRIPQTQTIRHFREFSVTNFLRGLRTWTGRELRPVSLSMRHPRNSHIADFERYFGCPVSFGAPANRVILKTADLETRLPTSDDQLLKLLRGVCEDVLEKRSHAPPTLTEQVELEIVNRLAKGEATLAIVARELGMSARTLSRRLSDLETSFNELLRELRTALANRYLQHSNLNLTEIAFLLGYTEVSTFSSAFKRWTGTTPGAARGRT